MDERNGQGGMRLGRRGSGFVAEAPCLYVWDEDAGAILRTAWEFAGPLGLDPERARLDAELGRVVAAGGRGGGPRRGGGPSP